MLLLLANPAAARITNIVHPNVHIAGVRRNVIRQCEALRQLTGVAYGEVDPRCDDHRHRVGAAQLAGDGRVFDRVSDRKANRHDRGNWTQRL